MSSHTPVRSLMLRLGIGGLALAGVLLGGTVMTTPSLSSATATSSSRLTEPPTKPQIEVQLHQVGITPETLAAAGANQAQVTAVVTDMMDHVVSNIESIRTAEVTWGDTRAELDRLQRLVESGRATQADLTAYSGAQTTFAAADAQRASVRSAIFGSGIENLSTDQRQVVDTLASNSSWDLPIQYRAANRDENDWIELRGALAQRRIAIRKGTELRPEASAIILAADADAAVAAASANLQGLPAVQAAWDAALEG